MSALLASTSLIFHPAILGMIAVFASVLWMLADQQDKTRPLLVFALIINLFYGVVLTIALGGENALLPWKYDVVLLQIDKTLGVSAAKFAMHCGHGLFPRALIVIYESLVPVMILFYFVQREQGGRGMVIRAYATEMIVGPIFYAILPACGPIYAFRTNWLHPAMEPAHIIRLSGSPNAFPSLHVATAFLFVLFAHGAVQRGLAFVFLLGTIISTISTGEHFIVDLLAGLVFGCFAGSVACSLWRPALFYLSIVGSWSVMIRYGFAVMIDHPYTSRVYALLTLLVVVHRLATWNQRGVGKATGETLVAEVHALPT